VPSLVEQSRRLLASPTQNTARPLVTPFSMAEMPAIGEAPDLRTRAGIRDRAMRHWGFAAGLRVSELLTGPRTAVTFHPAPTIRVLGQGRRERALPRWPQTADALQAWWAVRGAVGIPALCLHAQARGLTRAGGADVLRTYVRLAAHSCPSRETQQGSPPVLRHPWAMMIWHATGDLRHVARWLGHADMHTTAVSLRADPTDQIDAMAAVRPPALRRGHCTVPDHLIAA
jgi:integrase/recombinase XerD